MIQSKEELNDFYKLNDPWGYENNLDDKKRLEILTSEIPIRNYKNVLDIGCGNGFITRSLPGDNIFGIDISKKAIEHAVNLCNHNTRFNFSEGSIFELNKLFNIKFDLIVITGVLYPQYIGDSLSLIYLIIDELLMHGGILASVHIDDWYYAQFPYLKIRNIKYPYRSYIHNLEIYIK